MRPRLTLTPNANLHPHPPPNPHPHHVGVSDEAQVAVEHAVCHPGSIATFDIATLLRVGAEPSVSRDTRVLDMTQGSYVNSSYGGVCEQVRDGCLAFVFVVDAFSFSPTLAAGAGQSRPGLRPF